MMDAMVQFMCPANEVEKIKSLQSLRFEALVEILRDVVDKDLMIIDYYGLCDKPNAQHVFLADTINRGNFVMTTNFDFLIEHALMQASIPKEKIVTVITKEDYTRYSELDSFLAKGTKFLFKIHGSTKNITTGDDTRASLVATMQAFGSGKEGMNVFQIEPFKKALLDKITRERNLVIMGYSGSDDFDIIPTIKVLGDMKYLIWISHASSDAELISEISANGTEREGASTKIDAILRDTKRMNQDTRVFKVTVNTSKFIRSLLQPGIVPSGEPFSMNPLTWLRLYLTEPPAALKHLIAFRIYQSFGQHEDALRVGQEGIIIAEQTGDLISKATCLHSIGIVLEAQSQNAGSLKKFEEALEILENVDSQKLKAMCLNGIGLVHGRLREYDEAIKFHARALDIAKEIGDVAMAGVILGNIGAIQEATLEHDSALKTYEKCLRIAEELGDLNEKARLLNNIGNLHHTMGNEKLAMEFLRDSMLISENLADILKQATLLYNMASILHLQQRYEEERAMLEKSLQLAARLGDNSLQLHVLSNISEIHRNSKQYEEAIAINKKALDLAEILKDPLVKATCLNNNGMILYDAGNFQGALAAFLDAFSISEHRVDFSKNSQVTFNIGMIHFHGGDLTNAMAWFVKSAEFAMKLNDKTSEARAALHIAKACIAANQFEPALPWLDRSFNAANSAKDLPLSVETLINTGLVQAKRGKTKVALEVLTRANALAREGDYPEGIVSSSCFTGEIYLGLGKSDTGLAHFEAGVRAAEQAGLLHRLPPILNTIGTIYYNAKKKDKAIEAFQRALDILNQLGQGNTPNAATIKRNIDTFKE